MSLRELHSLLHVYDIMSSMKVLKVVAAVSKVIVAIGPLIDLAITLCDNKPSEQAITEKEMRRIVSEETTKVIKKVANCCSNG